MIKTMEKMFQVFKELETDNLTTFFEMYENICGLNKQQIDETQFLFKLVCKIYKIQNLEELKENSVSLEKMRKVFHQLSPRKQKILISHVNGKSYEEIGKEVNLSSKSSVFSHIHGMYKIFEDAMQDESN